MTNFLKLLKDGNKPSLTAAIVNTIIAILKAGAFFFTGNVAMFAEMMHSIGDAANQFFVFIGSALSKKAPTPKFPNGFGRLVNLVCLGAVIIVGILSYETIIEGWHHIQHPAESTGVAITLTVLAIGIILEFSVLYKAGKEILHEAGVKGTLLSPLTTSFTHLNQAKPATKLSIYGRFSCNIWWYSSICSCFDFSFYRIFTSRRYCFYYDWINDVLCSGKSILR